MKLQRFSKISTSLLLAAVLTVGSVSPAYAADTKSAKTTTASVRKPKISKNSSLYKELTKNNIFDYEYYKASNPDVVAALGTNYTALLNHFLNYGIYEGRQPNSDFNVNAYASAYSDLQEAFDGKGSDYQVILNYYTHYVNYGIKENREITTVEEATAAGITVHKAGDKDEVISTGSSAATAKTAPVAVSAPAPAPAPSVSQPSVPAPTPSQKEVNNPEPETPAPEVTPEPETPAPEVAPEPETPAPEVTPQPETPAPEVTPEPAECSHSFDQGTVTLAATRNSKGVKTFTCTLCEETKTEEIDKLTCADLGHGEGTETVITKENCETEGTYKKVCEYCGEQVGTTYIKPATGHSFDEGTVTLAATRTAKGEFTFTCETCGGTKTEDIAKLTCADLGHGDGTETVITKENCETDGTYKQICEFCGEQIDETYTKPATGHDYDEGVVTKAPSLTEEGVKTFTCSKCNDTYTENIARTECTEETHSFDEGTVTKAATRNVVGKMTYACEYCGAIKDEEIPKLTCETAGHVPATLNGKIWVVMPTCQQDGSYEYECAYCDEHCDYTEVPAGPDWHDQIAAYKYPTCYSYGGMYVRCSLCDYYEEFFSEEYAEHKYEILETIQQASCTQKGIYNCECSVCGDKTTREIEPAHLVGGVFTELTPGTCTERAVLVKYCTRCGEEAERAVGKYGHNYEWVVVNDATDSTDGLKEERCSGCSAVRESAVIDSLNKQNCSHENTHLELEKEATSSMSALYSRICDNCGKTVEENVTTVASCQGSHNFSEYVLTKESTPYSNGEETRTCANCGYTEYHSLNKTYCTTCMTTNEMVYNEEYHVYVCPECLRVRSSYGNYDRHYYCNTVGGHYQTYIANYVAPTETEYGHYDEICSYCGDVVNVVDVHPYKAYEIDLGDGQTTTVYGWLESDYNNTVTDGNNTYLDTNSEAYEVIRITNAYRKQNGRTELNWNGSLQKAADLRAIEASYTFDHTRPNGSSCFTLFIGGTAAENIALGYKNANSVMTGWEKSEGHNKNLLYPSLGYIGVGVFHRYFFNEEGGIPEERISWSQAFVG